MEWLWAQLTELYWNVFYRPDWRDVLDILIVAFLIYQLLRLTRQTRGSSVFNGMIVILVMTWISAAVKLRALNWVLVQLINTGAVLLDMGGETVRFEKNETALVRLRVEF